MDGNGAPPGSFALTEAQQGLWYFQALDPANPILNTGQYLELSGAVDLAALREAMARTIHETGALRLRFGPGPVQWLAEAGPEMAEVDLTRHPAPEPEALARMQADSGRAIDLARDQNAAFTLFHLGGGRYFLYQRIHHLAIDGYGFVLLTNRIGAHYGHLTAQAPEPRAFRGIETAFEEDAAYIASPQRDGDAAWWRARMADLPEVTGPAPGRAVSAGHFLRHATWIAPDLLARLLDWSDRNRMNWTDVLTGLVGAYLARWTGGEVVAGLPFMARMGRKIANLPCMAMNVLPQRIRPDEDAALADWLGPLLQEMREARRHGLYRSEALRRDLGLVGGARRLYGPLINIQPFDRPPVFPRLEVKLHILGAGAVDDLTLTFRGDPESGMLFEVDANPALYDAEVIAGHSARLPAFLDATLRAGRLAPVATATPAEIARIDAANAATAHPLPDTTLTALIEAQMQARPEAPALVFGDEVLSYAELDRRSAALAAHLQARGAGPDRLVAVLLDRSVELSVALVAVLRAGAGYLPLDPDHPPARLAGILEQARPVAVLTCAALADRLPGDAPLLICEDWPDDEGRPSGRPAPGDLAYVIFTSGSTGAPKGVMIEHRAIVNRLLWMRDHYGFEHRDRILQKTPASFDVSVWEFFLPYLCGGTLVMAPPGAHRDPVELARLIRNHGITTLHFVPSMLSAFLAAPQARGLQLARVFCSGEELTADQRARFHATVTAGLHNLYGPTEAAVDVSHWSATPDDRSNPLPIGFPVWNTALRVLDDRMRPVPPGLAGHLYLGGVQLARGYLGRPDLTAERFVPHEGARLYATGDLARLRPDGAVVYLGRSDHQVKIRGLRIELSEIEAAIMETGLAREAVVIAREENGEKRLVGYVVPAGGHRPGAIAAALGARLPAYMVPAAEVALDALPVTANGKLDRKALPAPVFAARGRAAETPTEILLARLFAEILHLDAPPPAEADFFALGGDSLSAVRLALRIEEETGRETGIGTIFEHPAIAALAQRLDGIADGMAAGDGLGPLLLLAEGDPAAMPLVLLHPAGGLGWGYRTLARAIAPERRVYALQHPCLDPAQPVPSSLTALAAGYNARLAAAGLGGPLHLAGWSVGGLIAQEMAVQRGEAVGMVALLDSYPADVWRAEPEPDPVAALRALLAIAGHDPDGHPELDSRAKVVGFLRRGGGALAALPEPVLDAVVRLVTSTNRLVRGHHHRAMSGRLTHIRAGRDHRDRDLTAALWQPWAAEVAAHEMPFLHAQMISAPAVAQIAPLLRAAMADQPAA
ncbi:amino acid adenylation domain-containing protein [Pseudogemmobacter sonorensis]|uniref:amino acid adenylation domain-containing protein n=1 Tax=Pseudogemmobacter sonorensis TaxID=2989681 RepID=UPI0036BAD838